MMSCCSFWGRRIQVSWGSSKVVLIRKVAPGLAALSRSSCLTNSHWWQATKLALFNQVGGADGVWPKPQVGHGDRAGLLGVVDKVALGVVVRIFADDFDGVLVGPHRTVGPQTVEHGPHHAVGFRLVAGVVVDGGEGDIIHNAHGEVVLGIGLARLSNTPLTMAGVNSLEERP
jgi:hypothetical protein